ncbi:MAG: NAD(P)-binding protein [Candidatus Lokiarchaeota archaeon]|nr:NAD(P)-binding protein [Candidatus Lokiarchaeota archaeon]MBD3198480.1 NAD(P)-binding protein [Candidatus Lokiarchaeota archaeon]
MNIIVIGSGLSGLTAAALMAKNGYSVSLFEQHEKIGGVTATIEKDGYRWDWGQMIVPDLGEEESGWKILKELEILDEIEIVKGYRENFYPDFEIRKPPEYSGVYWRKNYFKEIFPEDSKGLDKYYKIYDKIHDIASLSNKSGILAKLKLIFKFLPIMGKKNWSAKELMDYCFSNEKLQAVYTAILADYVASPEEFPGLIIPIINAENQYDERVPLQYGNHEKRSSWHFVKGGYGEIVNALANVIRDYGGNIITKTAIQNIHVEDNKVKSVKTNKGEIIKADIVIASGGARELFLDLIGQEFLPEEFIENHVKNIFTTESVFMVHLGVDYDPSVHQNNAALCYYYFTYDIDASIKECQEKIYHEGKDGLLIYIPSKHSPKMAPEGHHAVTVYTIAPNDPKNGNWEDNKEEWAEKLLDLAEERVPGLREHEQTRLILTPQDFKKRTYLKHHAFGGAVPHLKKSPPPHKTPIDGLWFVGAQSAVFGGVVGAMTSADYVVKQIHAKRGLKGTEKKFQTFSK